MEKLSFILGQDSPGKDVSFVTNVTMLDILQIANEHGVEVHLDFYERETLSYVTVLFEKDYQRYCELFMLKDLNTMVGSVENLICAKLGRFIEQVVD